MFQLFTNIVQLSNLYFIKYITFQYIIKSVKKRLVLQILQVYGIQGISQFVTDCSIDKIQQFIMLLNLIELYGVGHFDELDHSVVFSFFV